jgi:hypothetical protein
MMMMIYLHTAAGDVSLKFCHRWWPHINRRITSWFWHAFCCQRLQQLNSCWGILAMLNTADLCPTHIAAIHGTSDRSSGVCDARLCDGGRSIAIGRPCWLVGALAAQRVMPLDLTRPARACAIIALYDTLR